MIQTDWYSLVFLLIDMPNLSILDKSNAYLSEHEVAICSHGCGLSLKDVSPLSCQPGRPRPGRLKPGRLKL